MALTSREKTANFVKRRKEKELCIRCGEPLDRNGVCCIACNNKINAEAREAYRWYQSKGVCPTCRKNKLYGNEKKCLECNIKNLEAVKKANKKRSKEKIAEYNKKKYQERVEAGICVKCGKRKADYGHRTCGICREKGRNRYRIKNGYKEELRKERVENKECYICGKPVKTGYKVCEECYNMCVGNLDNDKRREATIMMKKNNQRFFKKM